MTEAAVPTVQQNNGRPLLPAPCAAVKPAINCVVLQQSSRTWCGKTEVKLAIKLDLCRLALGRNKVRSPHKSESFLQAQILAAERRLVQRRKLKCRPINKFCQRRNHALLSFFPSLLGNPAIWWITAVTSPWSFLIKVNCAPLILRKKVVSDSG